MAENKTLAGKFAAIMGEIQRVPKTGINKQQNYKFASESDISDMIRELLAKHNVALFVSMPGKPEQTEIQSKSGATGYHTLIEIEYTFVDGDTGEERTMKWHGEADAYDDKGISKATTLAQKYFLLKTFVMSTGDPQDDPDSSSETPAVRTSRPSTVNPRRIPEPPAAPASELDAHLGPRPPRGKGAAKPDEPPHTDELPPAAQDNGAEWRASTAPLTHATWAKFQPWLAHSYAQIGNVNHAAAAVMKALREAGAIPDGDAPDWGAVFGKVTPGDIIAALDAHYALAKAS